jgi:hypothetical protein
LSTANQKLSTYEKEFLAVMMEVDKWRSCLHENTFTIRSDHQSLCHLHDQNLSIELQTMAMRKLAGLQFKFSYKKGTENVVADALSRVAIHYHVDAISTAIPVWIQEVLNSYQNDPEASALLQELAVNSPNDRGYSLNDGIIRHKNKIWIGNQAYLYLSCFCLGRALSKM